MKILIIDDDERVRRTPSRILRLGVPAAKTAVQGSARERSRSCIPASRRFRGNDGVEDLNELHQACRIRRKTWLPAATEPGADIVGNGFVVSVTFAGKPGTANCCGKSVSALAQQYGGLAAAAAGFDYSSVQVLQNDIAAYCAS